MAALAGPAGHRGGGILSRWLVRAGQVALTVVVSWLIVTRVGLGLDELRGLDPAAWVPSAPILAGSVLLLLVGYFMSAVIWGRIVADLGGPRLPGTDAVRIFMIANLGRYVPGKVWQIAGLAALAGARGVPATTATGAAVLGQGLALAAAALVGLAGVLSAPDALPGWGIALSVAVLAGAVVIALPPVFRSLVGAWFRVTRTEPPASFGGVHGARWLALYVLNWAVYALAFWALVASFGIRASAVPVASAFAAAYVLGYVMIFAPAGIGVREGFLVVLLGPHLGVGPAGAIAVISRVWTTVVEVVPAAAFWLRRLRDPQAGGVGATGE